MDERSEDKSRIEFINEQKNIQQLKRKLNNICKNTRFCGICLEYDEKLWAVETDFDIAVGQQTYKKSLKNVIEYILNDEGQQILSSPHLCSPCIEKSIQAYLFIYNAKQLAKIILKCVNELYSKATEVSDQLQFLNDDYTNSNIVIVLEQDTEMCQYTDIGKMTEIIAKETQKSFVDTKFTTDEEVQYCFENECESTVVGNTPPVIVETIESVYSEVSKQETSADVREVPQTIAYHKVHSVKIEEINLQHDSNTLGAELDGNDEQIQIISTGNDLGLNENCNIEPERTTVDVNIPVKRKLTEVPSVTYKCYTCREILPTYKGWKEHKKLCRKLKDIKNIKHSFKCKMCKETFITQRSLNTHYKTHSKVRCKVCQFIVPLEDVTEHMKLNHEDYIHTCKLCKFFSFNADGLEAHMTKNHTGSKCALCFKKVKESELKLHRCRFSCLECYENICIHYKYLISYREQVLNNVTKIKCLDCDYICPRREALLGHVNREHLNHHPFTCAHCSQQFYSRTTLRYHLNQFHKDRHICEFCDQEFNSVMTLNNHKESCESVERQHKCQMCASSFNALEELANHFKLRHEESPYGCNLCKRKFLSSIKLQEHMFKVHNGLQMKRKKSILDCPVCDIRFENKKQLMQHIESHGPDVRFPCRECSVDFDSIKKLHAHVRIHYDDVIQCLDCKKVLTSTFFPRHLVYCKPAREGNELYTCETCGKTCTSENQLKLHRKNHLEKIPCPVCKKPTKPVYMKNHIKYMHSKPRKPKKESKGKVKYYIKCNLCDHMVSRQGELEAHVNRFHLKRKPYQCNYCQKSFFGRERLRDHLVTHTTTKTCFCSVCHQKFENKACLKLHMRRHTGYTPYACEICGDRFRTSSIMNTHKVKKHSERTVSCPLCESMFYLTREMRSHFKKVHWKQKGKKFDPRDVKELAPEYYHLFEDGRLPKVDGEGLYISSKYNEKFD